MKGKTITLEESTHIKLCEIQLNLRKFGIEKTLREINNLAINNGINNVFEIIKNNEVLKRSE